MDTMALPGAVRRTLALRRRWRIDRALRGIETRPGMKVLDIGCGIDGRSFSDHADPSWRITGLDRTNEPLRHRHPRFRFVHGCATNLSTFANDEFDLAVSIGMLEHITEPEAFARACSEMQRVAKQIVVIVPSRWALIEPHYPLPFFGVWPEKAQVAAARLFNIGGQRAVLRHDPGFLRRQTVWRTRGEYEGAFKGCAVQRSPFRDTWTIATQNCSHTTRTSAPFGMLTEPAVALKATT